MRAIRASPEPAIASVEASAPAADISSAEPDGPELAASEISEPELTPASELAASETSEAEPAESEPANAELPVADTGATRRLILRRRRRSMSRSSLRSGVRRVTTSAAARSGTSAKGGGRPPRPRRRQPPARRPRRLPILRKPLPSRRPIGLSIEAARTAVRTDRAGPIAPRDRGTKPENATRSRVRVSANKGASGRTRLPIRTRPSPSLPR